MPRRTQSGSGGLVFHVLNRGSRRGWLFRRNADYREFLCVIREAQCRVEMRLLAFALMPNHWHLLLWPRQDPDLSRFMQWLTRTHAVRWHLANGSAGTGAVYQGRFRAIPIQHDAHLAVVGRYIERNPARAGLSERAEDWPWSSAWPLSLPGPRPVLDGWPIPKPRPWLEWVNGTDADRDVDRLRSAIRRQVPFGAPDWSRDIAGRLDQTAGLRGRGRPRRVSPRETGWISGREIPPE